MTNNETPVANPTAAPKRGRGIAVAFTVVGLVIAGSGTAVAAASAARFSDKQSDTFSVNADDIRNVEIDGATAKLSVVFADTDEATLEVQTNRASGVSAWQLTTKDDTLVVKHDGGWFGGGWFFGASGEETVVLTLPEELNGVLDLDLDNDAGTAIVDGDFVNVDVNIGAGDVEINGAMEELELSVSAGSARLAVRDLSVIDVEVSAGSVRGSVSGTAPNESTFQVSAGEIDLTLPDVPYRVNSDVDFGDANVDLDSDSTAKRTINIEVSAGDITLRRD